MMLGLLAVIALLSAGALHDALFGEQLAGSRVLHQRADALATIGVRDAMERIGSMHEASATTYALQPLPTSPGSISVTVRHLGTSRLPAGFSSDAFEAHHFEIESTGHVARGIRMTHVQGAVRVMPAGAAAAEGAVRSTGPT